MEKFYNINMYEKLIEINHKKKFGSRFDDNHIFFYFKASDFKGLRDKKYEFSKKDGTILRGHFYNYSNYNKKDLIIFCHGFASSHRSYFPEINQLCLNGYRVFAFDYKGTFESDGENLGGFTEPIEDLYTLLNTFREQGYFKKYRISLVGHSWGGFAIGNVLNFIDDIYKAVIISGPTSSADYLSGSMPKFMPFKAKAIESFLQKEAKIYPQFYDSTSLNAYKKTATKVLLVQSTDDPVVNFEYSSKIVKDVIGDKDNLEYYFINHHSHNPTYTNEASTYFNKVFNEYYNEIKHHKLKTIGEKKNYFKNVDWDKMTEIDHVVMNRIIDFLQS